MPSTNIRAFRQVLQNSINLEDRDWSYQVSNLPRPPTLNRQKLIKCISLESVSEKGQIVLKLEVAPLNRAITSDPLDRFMTVSFANFRLRVPQPTTANSGAVAGTRPATARESGGYIAKLLRSGVTLNGVHYNFYGHSNSQLKSRTCFMYAASKEDISRKVEALGDFSKMKTVAKKAKRIGLLFSTATVAMDVRPDRCEDIEDVRTEDYVFTDGCGLISPQLAHELARRLGISFRNVRYTPSVFQIRYRGYKGVLTLDPAMRGKTLVKFRRSMKKFSGGDDYSFSVVEYSKPYKYGYINDEILLLLHALGVQETVLLKKQEEHFDYLARAQSEPSMAFRFLTYMGEIELAEKLLLESMESVQTRIAGLVGSEYNRMLNKRDEQRCRILIEKSRLLFGVCDAWDVLKAGECYVCVTTDGDGQPRALKGAEVLVTRNPCLHPGDLQKFKAVMKKELSHLVDCIVFSTRGKRPSADLMSGGDLDGDTFFVCWDKDLIPDKLSQPAKYPGGKELQTFRAITDDDRLEYFARYNNASLGRVKNLFLDWARLVGPMSAECQQLNRLFSQCVDGNRIRVPPNLESPPMPLPTTPPFILDVMHDAAAALIQGRQGRSLNCDGYDFDAMELLLSRSNIAMSEFELLKLTYRWCRRNGVPLEDFLYHFDLNLLTTEQKAWALNHLPPSAETSSLILNALNQSSLLHDHELKPFKLDYPGLRWKCVYNSTRDRLAVFLDTVTRTLELFVRKLIVIRVDERLTLAIYIPQKVERDKECLVDNRVRLFAFPHSKGDETRQRLALPTKENYRLYCDSNVFQLYENHRRNTWIYIGQGPSDDSSYRSLETKSEMRRGRSATLDDGVNFDNRVSVNLNKFSHNLQKHIGRVHRNGVLGAEIYIISNRDVRSMQNLDLWLEFVDTKEVIPLFERKAREYTVPKLPDVDWSGVEDYIVQIAKFSLFPTLSNLASPAQYRSIFEWLLERNQKGLLLQAFKYILSRLREPNSSDANTSMALRVMLEFLNRAPFLAITFAELGSWDTLPSDVYEVLERLAPMILQANILSANEMQELVVEPFKKILAQLRHMPLAAFAELVELIALAVRSPEIALDLLLECLEPESSRILVGRPALIRHFVRNLIGIALDHIDEATQPKALKYGLLDLNVRRGESMGYSTVQTNLRIDSLGGALAISDHIYSMDALVDSYEPGSATFRCYHPLPLFVEQCSWELQNCGPFVTTKTMLDAVRDLDIQREENCGIFDLILGIQEGRREGSIPDLEYNPKESLNASQNSAVKSSLSYPLTCLWGPPGTGKTYTIVEIIRQLQLSKIGSRILVTAPTHNAVDNVMRKYLGNAVLPHDTTGPVALRVSTDVRKVAEDLKGHTCDAMAGKEIYSSRDAFKKARDQIKKCHLVFTTCIGAGLGLLRDEVFDTVIIDEASQQTEPASLVPLTKGCQKAILVGDHVQLGATVQRHAVALQYDISLFERLYTSHESPGSDRICRIMLDTQYRMHRSICKFSSAEFYEGRLRTGVLDDARPLAASQFPWPTSTITENGQKRMTRDNHTDRMIFVQCFSQEEFSRKSKTNEGQADLCREICGMLCTAAPASPSPRVGGPSKAAGASKRVECHQQQIAVLTPYSRQAELLKKRLSHLPNIEVSSIDGFQGREADIVIFVTVRCNVKYDIGFLKELRRMNVVLTRAKAAVIVIGDRATLTKGTADPESRAVWERLLGRLAVVELGSEEKTG